MDEERGDGGDAGLDEAADTRARLVEGLEERGAVGLRRRRRGDAMAGGLLESRDARSVLRGREDADFSRKGWIVASWPRGRGDFLSCRCRPAARPIRARNQTPLRIERNQPSTHGGW